MAVIAPSSDVYLLKVPLEMDNTNQLTFASREAQYNYFRSLPSIEAYNYTYQRKDNIIRFGGRFDDLIQYNYVMYRNEAYSNKWFYAYIDNMEYVNDNVTNISISTDCWQTWQFDLAFKRTFVAREHTNDDTIGANTIPENVELGEPTVNGNVVNKSPTLTGYYITFMVSDVTPLNITTGPGGMYNQVFSGYTIFGVNSATDARGIIYKYISSIQGGGADAIQNIFMVPKELYGTPTIDYLDQIPGYSTVTVYYPQPPAEGGGTITLINSTTIERPTSLDNYTPRNRKLYTYPYSYLFMSNNVGGDTVYHYEDFVGANPTFRMDGIINSGCDIKINPLNYKNVATPNETYGMKLGKLPVCSWNTDSYAIWLAQNQLNMNLAMKKAAVTAVVGAASKNPIMLTEAASGAVGAISETITGSQIANEIPDQVHGNPNSSDYNFSKDLNISFRRMSIKAQYARIIDEYFDMAGYATNRVKVPNVFGRRNWNYVQTIGCYIEADIPQSDLQTIKNMFNHGVTFWHNPSTFADYSQNNDIIS